MMLARWCRGAVMLSLSAVLALPAMAQVHRAMTNDGMRLLAYPAVQKELQLSPEQTQKLDRVRKDSQAHTLEVIRSLSRLAPEERQKKLDALRDEQDHQLVQLLDTHQRQRLRQIGIQQLGARALLRNDIAGELGLSQEQKEQLRKVASDEFIELRHSLASAGGDASSAADNDAARRKVEEIQRHTGEKLVAVLKPAQRKQFQELQGAPFHLPTPGRSAKASAH